MHDAFLSPEDMAMQLSALWHAVDTNGDPGLDGFMVQLRWPPC